MTQDKVLLIRAEAAAKISGQNIFAHACELFARDRGISASSAGTYIAEKFPEFHKRHFRGQ